jgi:hypothetical protein
MRQTSLGALGIVRTPIKKGTHTPTTSTSGKKKAARSGAATASPSPRYRIADGGKYGFCPTCAIGRRVRAPFDPRGNPLKMGKLRLVCSRKNEGSGCDYMRVLDSDPADSSGLYKATSSPASQAKGGEEEEQEDEDELQMAGPSKIAKFAMTKKGLSTPTRKLFSNKNATPGKKLFGDKKATAGKKLTGSNKPTPGNDTPQKSVGCPECITGKLTEKVKDIFHFTQTIMVCEEVFDLETRKEVGGCGYILDPAEDSEGDGDGAGLQDKAKDGDKKEQAKNPGLEKRELDELVAAEREKALANPNAAVVMAGPANKTPKKKVLVDLTDDDEMLGLRPYSGPSAGAMVGAHAPIVIDDDEAEDDDKPKDDEAKDAGDFDDIDTADEMELVRISDEANQATVADMDEQEERELMELTDQVEASQR